MTSAQQKLFNKVKSEGWLILEFDNEEEVSRFFLPSGKVVNRVTARCLISAGRLVPKNDGLIAEISQSFEPAA